MPSRAEAAAPLTISRGVTGFRPEVADPTTLLVEADRALYASKQGGRNRVSVYEPAGPEPAKGKVK